MLPLVVFKWVFWSFFLSFKFSFSLKWNRPCLPNCNLLVHLHKGLHRNTREANLKCAFPHAEAFSSNSHLNTPPHTRTTHTPHTPHTPPPSVAYLNASKLLESFGWDSKWYWISHPTLNFLVLRTEIQIWKFLNCSDLNISLRQTSYCLNRPLLIHKAIFTFLHFSSYLLMGEN